VNYWVPHLRSCAEAIQRKMNHFGLPHAAGEYNADFAFIDNTLRRTCRPGGGPRSNGTRYHNDIQQAFYQGWKKIHALKWQTVDMPNGMTFHMFPAVSGRRSDLHTLRMSNINNIVANCQTGNERQYVMYGDSIYPVMSHLRKRNNNPLGNTAYEILQNEVMKKIRVTIEWNYGATSNLFQYIDYRRNLKILSGGSNVAKSYVVATLLRNFHNCVYASQTAEYFDIAPPSLESYILQDNTL
jgi:hypothetical protein